MSAPLDLDALAALADAATPGPWCAGNGWVYFDGECESPNSPLRDVTSDQPTAEFIAAADPATILALIERVRFLEEALADPESALGAAIIVGAGYMDRFDRLHEGVQALACEVASDLQALLDGVAAE